MSGRLKSLVGMLVITMVGSLLTLVINARSNMVEGEINSYKSYKQEINFNQNTDKRFFISNYLYIETNSTFTNIILTDSFGKKVGKNFLINKEFNEIEGAHSYQESYESPVDPLPYEPDESNQIIMENPKLGDYTLELIGLDGGEYKIYISTNWNSEFKNPNQKTQYSSLIKKGETQNFTLTLSENGEVELFEIN